MCRSMRRCGPSSAAWRSPALPGGLQAAQQKVEILLKRSGQPEVQPFEGPGDESAAGSVNRE